MDEDFIKKLFLNKFPSVNLHYLNRYAKFITIKFNNINCITEKHHILPKSIWPEYDKIKNNHIKLSLKAHFIAHWILIKMLPNNEEMTYAFYYMCNRNENKNKNVKGFSELREKVLLKLKKVNDKRLAEGTHNFQGENNPSHKRVTNNTHNFQGERNPNHRRVLDGSLSAFSKKLNKERVKKGIHQFQGEHSPIHRLIAEGRHPSQNDKFKKLLSDLNKKRVEDGTHPFSGLKAWEQYGANEITINTWKFSSNIKIISAQNPKYRYKKLFAAICYDNPNEKFSLTSIRNMVKMFDNGWEPEKDEKWLEFFKKNVDTR